MSLAAGEAGGSRCLCSQPGRGQVPQVSVCRMWLWSAMLTLCPPSVEADVVFPSWAAGGEASGSAAMCSGQACTRATEPRGPAGSGRCPGLAFAALCACSDPCCGTSCSPPGVDSCVALSAFAGRPLLALGLCLLCPSDPGTCPALEWPRTHLTLLPCRCPAGGGAVVCSGRPASSPGLTPGALPPLQSTEVP